MWLVLSRNVGVEFSEILVARYIGSARISPKIFWMLSSLIVSGLVNFSCLKFCKPSVTYNCTILSSAGGGGGGGCCGGVHEGLRPGDGLRSVAAARRGDFPSALPSILQHRRGVAEASSSPESAVVVRDGHPSYQQVTMGKIHSVSESQSKLW